jgi:putative thioredoxin
MADQQFVVEVGEHNFEAEVLQRSLQQPVLVDFWAAWCAPCKALMPLLAKLADEYAGGFMLAKVNTDEHQQLAMQCGIRSLPTVMLVKDGQIIDGFVGAQPESAIRALLDKHGVQAAGSEAPPAPLSVSEQLGGDRQQAIAVLRAQLQQMPDDEMALLELSELLIAEGDYQAAGECAARVPEGKGGDQLERVQAALRLAAQLDGAPGVEELRQRLGDNARDSEAQYLLALRQALAGDAETALESLVGIVTRDRKYGDDAARKAMIEIFSMLGGTGPVVKQYRSRLYSAMN